MGRKRKPFWDEVRKRYEAGESQKSLAREYGVTPAAVLKRRKVDGWDEQHQPPKPHGTRRDGA